MLIVKCGLECRGVESKTSSKGNQYFLLHMESEDGTAYQFALMSDKADIVINLKKGNVYKCELTVRPDNRQCNLSNIIFD